MVGGVRSSLNLLLAAVGLLLLIACVNVANLLLVRPMFERARWRSERRSARPWTHSPQLLVESVALSSRRRRPGASRRFAGVRLLLALSPGNNPFGWEMSRAPRCFHESATPERSDHRLARLHVHARRVTRHGIVFGLLPALHSARVDLVAAMKRTTASRLGARGSRASRILVAVEMTLAVMLLVGAALLIRTSLKLRAVDSGFEPSAW